MGNSLGPQRDDNFLHVGVNNGNFPLASSVNFSGVSNTSSFPSLKRAADLLEMKCSLGRDEEKIYLGIELRSSQDGKIDRISDRQPLNLAIVLDVSGSMMNGLSEPKTEEEILNMRSKFEMSKQFVTRIWDNLKQDDMYSVSWFAEEISGTAVQPIRKNEDEESRTEIGNAVQRISCGGGTKLILGMEQALAAVREMKEQNPDGESRIVFMTDMTDTAEDEDGVQKLFDLSMKLANEENIHVSYVGLGLDFDVDTTAKISSVPGCNYFSILDESDFDRRISINLNSAFMPVCSHVELNVHSRTVTIDRVEGMEQGTLEKDIAWTPQTHRMYPKKVRDIAFTLACVFKRMELKIPNDVLGLIIGHVHPSTRFQTKDFR